MKSLLKIIAMLLIVFLYNSANAQDYEIKTLIGGHGLRGSGGYGAVSNKFTRINGDYANLVEIYGGWYINHKFLLGVGAAAATNNIPVPAEFSSLPGFNMSYEYGQVGLMTEYTLWSNRAIHLSCRVLNGAGFTVQYMRNNWEDDEYWEDDFHDYPRDSNWFFVTEPGVKVELNLLKWLRFSPGVSYRAAFGSDAEGLSDDNISGFSLDATLKFGKI